MLQLAPVAVTTPALITLFGTGGLHAADHVAAWSVLWSPSEPGTAAFLELLCCFFPAPESRDWGLC